jgi:hypothetical protein
MRPSFHLIVLSLHVLGLCVVQAQTPDCVWVGGLYEQPVTNRSGNYAMRPIGGGAWYSDTLPPMMNFEATVAMASDSSGRLLFYTNGCFIATPEGDTVVGSMGLNPGWVHERTCAENGYIAPRGAMALPMPGHSDRFVLIHNGVEWSTQTGLEYRFLYYSIIDLSSGITVVTSINQVLLEGNLETFNAVRHGNGRDWWIVTTERHSAIYHLWLLSPSGFSHTQQELGASLHCTRIGSASFSRSGHAFARTNNCATVVLDFDRCVGVFSNPRMLPRTQHVFGGGGVVFSPDDTQVWISELNAILSADLTSASPAFDTLVSALDIRPISLHHLAYGPDGLIYADGMHRYEHLSRIRFDASGQPQFQQTGVMLPFWNVRTLPNVPNFHLYDLPNSLCDTLNINAPVNSTSVLSALSSVLLFPNPAHEQVELRWEAATAKPHNLILVDALGRICYRSDIPAGSLTWSIRTIELPEGFYVLKVQTKGQHTAYKKLLIVH